MDGQNWIKVGSSNGTTVSFPQKVINAPVTTSMSRSVAENATSILNVIRATFRQTESPDPIVAIRKDLPGNPSGVVIRSSSASRGRGINRNQKS